MKGPVWNCGRHAVPRELNYSVDAANSSTMPGIYTERMSAFNLLNITTIQSVESKTFVSIFFVGLCVIHSFSLHTRCLSLNWFRLTEINSIPRSRIFFEQAMQSSLIFHCLNRIHVNLLLIFRSKSISSCFTQSV